MASYKLLLLPGDGIGPEVMAEVEKVTDPRSIAMAGVMSTPGIAIDGKLVHSGGLPDKSRLEGWIAG